jgi:hypothetical protein
MIVPGGSGAEGAVRRQCSDDAMKQVALAGARTPGFNDLNRRVKTSKE